MSVVSQRAIPEMYVGLRSAGERKQAYRVTISSLSRSLLPSLPRADDVCVCVCCVQRLCSLIRALTRVLMWPICSVSKSCLCKAG
jgi:hypothetical protein